MRAVLACIVIVIATSGCLIGPESSAQDAGLHDQNMEIKWPAIDEALLRPGDKLFPYDIGTEDGITLQTCTINFVFVSEDNSSVYVGTASHCLTGFTVGDEILLSGKVLATVAYCSWGTIDESEDCTDKATGGVLTNPDAEGFANDFALLRITDDQKNDVHPALHHWGGPTGFPDSIEEGNHAMTYGNSAVRDGGTDQDVHDAREGYVRKVEPWTTTVLFFTGPLPGDSGSPVLLGDGSALGVVQTQGNEGAGIVNLEDALGYYNDHAEIPVRLAVWELLNQPSLPEAPITHQTYITLPDP